MSDTIEITVNGAPHTLDASATVRGLLASMGIDPNVGGIAVAVRDAVVPKSRWDETTLETGDTVEIVRATAGG